MLKKFWYKYYYCKELINEKLYDVKIYRKVVEFYWDTIPYDYRPGQLWYRSKCFLFKRYTTVKPRYLPHTWTDRCDLLPHMMFEILSDFIEGECSPGNTDWNYKDDDGEWYKKIKRGKELINVRDEMQDLYDWWHQVYVPWSENTPEVSEWADFDRSHRLTSEDNLDEYFNNPRYDSEENKQQSREMMNKIHLKEREMDRELKKRMHRLINIVDYMWT